MSFLNKHAKSLKNSRKGVLFLSETHPKHSKHIDNTIMNVYAPTIASFEQESI